jgi:hypothetical protein
VGVSVSGLATGPVESSAPPPVLTIRSPPFDEEAPSEVPRGSTIFYAVFVEYFFEKNIVFCFRIVGSLRCALA